MRACIDEEERTYAADIPDGGNRPVAPALQGLFIASQANVTLLVLYSTHARET